MKRISSLSAALLLLAGCIVQTEGAPDNHDDGIDNEPHDIVFVAQDVDLLDQLAPDEDDGWLQTQVFTAEAPFNRVAFRFDAETAPRVQVRVSYDNGASM